MAAGFSGAAVGGGYNNAVNEYFGTIAGGFLPELWGASAWGFSSLVFSSIGGIAGVWLGVRIAD